MKTLMMIGASAAALALPATMALAQDAPRDWSGAYVGGSFDYSVNDHDQDETLAFDTDLDGQYGDRVPTASGGNAFAPGYCVNAGNGPTPASGCDKDHDGAGFGVRGGYDWQFGNWVVGAVGEASRVNVEDSVTGFSTTPTLYTMTRTLDWTAAARLRAGYAMGDTLPYVTGGAAYGKISNSFFTGNGANTFTVQEDDEDASGWQLGGGVEHRVTDNLSLGAEYLYTSLDAGDHVIRAGGPAPADNPFLITNPDGTDIGRTADEFNTHTFRLTAAYRF